MPPSWMIKLTEGWGKPKKDSEGEDNGFKKEEREGVGRGKICLPANIVRLQNPFIGWTGALIGAVGRILIATCQSETCPFAAVHGRKEIWRTCEASIVLSKKLFCLSLDWEYLYIVIEARFIGGSSNRLWKKPHLSVACANQGNLVG